MLLIFASEAKQTSAISLSRTGVDSPNLAQRLVKGEKSKVSKDLRRDVNGHQSYAVKFRKGLMYHGVISAMNGK